MTDEPREELELQDLAKSMLRLPWAMSMLMASEAANLVGSRQGARRSAAVLDTVSHLAEEQLGATARGFYQFGARLQASAVDRLTAGTGVLQPLVERIVGNKTRKAEV